MNLASVLEQSREFFSAALLDEHGYSNLVAIGEHLPEQFSAFWGLECRLSEPRAAMDILVEATAASGAHRLLAGLVDSPLRHVSQDSPTWQRLAHFARWWADPARRFWGEIRNVWLEFDTASASSEADLEHVFQHPCIFFGPQPGLSAPKDRHDLIWETLQTLEADEAGVRHLQGLFDALPESAQVFQVGLMLSRPNGGLRICVEQLAPAKMPAWLAAIGWEGDTRWLGALLEYLETLVKHLLIDVTLTGNGIAERIGIECYMDWSQENSEQWLPSLDFFKTRNLCLPGKYQGILQFPGTGGSFCDEKKTGDQERYIYLFRKIHHLKLSIQANRMHEAKAYLAFGRVDVLLNPVQLSENGTERFHW